MYIWHYFVLYTFSSLIKVDPFTLASKSDLPSQNAKVPVLLPLVHVTVDTWEHYVSCN